MSKSGQVYVQVGLLETKGRKIAFIVFNGIKSINLEKNYIWVMSETLRHS
jgi:hypothetical protein